MNDMLKFPNREEFTNWLISHCLSDDGVWLLFDRTGNAGTLTAGKPSALAGLTGRCKASTTRPTKKNRSAPQEQQMVGENKVLVEHLEKKGVMTDYGRAKIA